MKLYPLCPNCLDSADVEKEENGYVCTFCGWKEKI
jgi:DNA-directed RNA polymerase subunit RPC12/RpoP